MACPGLATEMNDIQTCPLGAHSQVGERGEEKTIVKKQDNRAKMEIPAQCSGVPGWGGRRRDPSRSSRHFMTGSGQPGRMVA